MISHPFILLFYRLTGLINRLLSAAHKKIIERNYENNKGTSLTLRNGFIEDQEEESGLLYGSGSFTRSGCGTAAVYNALVSLGIPVPLHEIIRYFEKYGASIFAYFGTSPQSAVRFLRRVGLEPRTASTRKGFWKLAETSDILIFTILNNRKNIRGMLHTMCMEKKNNSLLVHNSHGRAETYGSYEEMMQSLGEGNGKASGVYMIGLNRRA